MEGYGYGLRELPSSAKNVTPYWQVCSSAAEPVAWSRALVTAEPAAPAAVRHSSPRIPARLQGPYRPRRAGPAPDPQELAISVPLKAQATDGTRPAHSPAAAAAEQGILCRIFTSFLESLFVLPRSDCALAKLPLLSVAAEMGRALLPGENKAGEANVHQAGMGQESQAWTGMQVGPAPCLGRETCLRPLLPLAAPVWGPRRPSTLPWGKRSLPGGRLGVMVHIIDPAIRQLSLLPPERERQRWVDGGGQEAAAVLSEERKGCNPSSLPPRQAGEGIGPVKFGTDRARSKHSWEPCSPPSHDTQALHGRLLHPTACCQWDAAM